jgi:hypothetical protein
MKIKTIVTGILLVFVVCSVAYLVVSESRKPEVVAEVSERSAAAENPATDASSATSSTMSDLRHKVIAYYFYGNVRCVTCRTIEAYTEEALKASFSDELTTGRLEWRPLNVMLPENEHFVSDYKLATRSVVIVDVFDGKQRTWTNLTRVWELVRNKPGFVEYIQEETRNYLKEAHD